MSMRTNLFGVAARRQCDRRDGAGKNFELKRAHALGNRLRSLGKRLWKTGAPRSSRKVGGRQYRFFPGAAARQGVRSLHWRATVSPTHYINPGYTRQLPPESAPRAPFLLF